MSKRVVKASDSSRGHFEKPPEKLTDHIFYGMTLDPEQEHFRDMIWDEEKRIVFANARAGVGKTTIAIATAVMMVDYHMYDNIVYVVNPSGDAQGFLPGTISEKSSVWFEGLYQALIVANKMPDAVISTESMINQKNGNGFVTAITTSYLRGSNIGADSRTVLILDETQNFGEFELRKTLTRACDTTKVICIGHTGQIDLRGQKSGFEDCMRHFKSKNDPRFAFCELHTNHRGLISNTADEPWTE